jgi:hypothetical protein
MSQRTAGGTRNATTTKKQLQEQHAAMADRLMQVEGEFGVAFVGMHIIKDIPVELENERERRTQAEERQRAAEDAEAQAEADVRAAQQKAEAAAATAAAAVHIEDNTHALIDKPTTPMSMEAAMQVSKTQLKRYRVSQHPLLV